MPAAVAELLGTVPDRAATVVLRNGWVCSVERGSLDAAVVVGSGAEQPGSLDGAPVAADGVDELHDALVADVLLIDVPDGVVVERPVVVIDVTDADGATAAPHVVVRTGTAAQVTVLHFQLSGDTEALVLPTVELHAADASNLRFLEIQDLARTMWQVGNQRIDVGRDANVLSGIVALGGSYARVRTVAALEGQAGTADLVAVYFSDGDQMHDFRTVQDHVAPRTGSHLLFRGAVEDDAHAVYTGLIKVRQGAKQSSSFLANRNLVLSETSRVDSVPNLEITNENDIKNCGHASATGPIDEEQRFYLESRGVPTEVAERLIVLGFFDDVISRMPLPELRPLLRQAVALKLDKVIGGSAG